MTVRGITWAGIVLMGLGIAGIVFTGVASGAGAPLPWAQYAHPSTTASLGGFGGMMGGQATGSLGGMMGGDAMGQMMGAALAGSASQRVSPAEATSIGNAVPAGATVDRAKNVITYSTKDVRFAALGSPQGGPDMTFRVAGLADPTIVVPVGAQVSVQFINADIDTSHAWLLTAAQGPFSYMAMMATPVAFAGAFAAPLGELTSAGLPGETISFTAATPGRYTYLCPVPGHAQRGMSGSFVVTRG